MNHRIARDAIHTAWDREFPPTLTIDAGDTVVFETLDASYGNAARRVQAGQETALAHDLRAVIAENAYPERPATGLRGHPLTGPVFVRGATPGDTLVVEILDVQTGAWGWTSCRPKGIGLLDDLLESEGHLTTQAWQYWDLRDGTHATFKSGIRVPIVPFCGVMGVAPAESGPLTTSPPRQVGGNMDIRQLVRGATLELPVEVEGALFSVGDVHAAQGDGELCGTGIETDGTVTLRFSVRRDRRIETPQLWAPAELDRTLGRAGWFATTGHAPDLRDATRTAVLAMLRHLNRERGLSMVDAYILASVCVDLKISQIVDAPNWTVSAFLPLSIFTE